MRNILEHLGDPVEIAADARERFEVQPSAPAQPYKPGWMEVGALVMLLVGGLILPDAYLTYRLRRHPAATAA